jgi:hypothetical protein
MKNYLIIILSILFLNVSAQETDFPELIGDRPDQTESAFVMPKGYFQFEDGFIYENENSFVQNISYSSMLLRYGLFKNFELRFVTEYNKTKVKGLSDVKGFSPFAIGTKIHVHEEKAWLPQIALLAHINVAKTGASSFMQQFHSTQMALTFNHTLSDVWSVGYSLGVEFPSEINYSIATYTLVSGFSITDKLGAFIEAYGDFSKYRHADNKVNAGITYLIAPSLQFDFAGGFGLSENSADNYYTMGLIYLFKI